MSRLRSAPHVALFLAGAAAVAWKLAAVVAGLDIGQPIPGQKNVFYRLYGLYERPHFLLMVLFLTAAAIYLSWRHNTAAAGLPRARVLARPASVTILAIVVVGVAWLGFRSVMHAFPLSMDEFNTVFQAKLFASGHISATVLQPWDEMATWITPGFVGFNRADHTWLSMYLPVYSALRAVTELGSVPELLNPLLAGGSVLAIAAVARRLWPGSTYRSAVAALLLASSSQFLAMSMTTYSMPAHLCANLLWLLLYLKSDGKAFGWELLLLPWLGILALGLHNPFPHALFAAPFLLRMVRRRVRSETTYVAAVYLLGGALCLAWWHLALPATTATRALASFGLPGGSEVLTQMMNLSLLMSWQTPVLILGACMAMANRTRLGTVERDLLTSLVLTLGFYFAFRSSQGHGWGYRYAYGVLGNLVLLGVAGLGVVVERRGRGVVAKVAAASLATTLAVQLPLRAVQIEGFVRPFADASRMILQSASAAVVIPTGEVWYGSDLVRNGPFLHEPVVVAASIRSAYWQREWLSNHFGAAVRYLRPDTMKDLGLAVARVTSPEP